LGARPRLVAIATFVPLPLGATKRSLG